LHIDIRDFNWIEGPQEPDKYKSFGASINSGEGQFEVYIRKA
jgi:hypothetical protein